MTNPAREAKGSVVDEELLASIRRVFRDHHDEEFFFGLGRFISAYADAEGAALAVARKAVWD